MNGSLCQGHGGTCGHPSDRINGSWGPYIARTEVVVVVVLVVVVVVVVI